MSRYLLILFTTLLLSCGQFVSRKSNPDSQATLSEVQARSNFYVDNMERDEFGFILSDKCDSLLFSGLLAAARPDLNIDILAARDKSGAWHRRPTQDCSPSIGNSRSTISRDMLIGLFWYMWRTGDVKSANQLMLDLQGNNYLLRGEGTPGELLVTPALVQTLAEMIYRLGGPNYQAERHLPAYLTPNQVGFEAHLTVWHILLRGEVYGRISAEAFSILQFQSLRQPENPLFQAAYARYLDGNYDSVIKLLITPRLPADRLPTSLDYCDEWPIQRDLNARDWGPCEPETVHTGADLVVIYHLILE